MRFVLALFFVFLIIVGFGSELHHRFDPEARARHWAQLCVDAARTAPAPGPKP